MPTKFDRQNTHLFVKSVKHLSQARLNGVLFGVALGADEWYLKDCTTQEVGGYDAVIYQAVQDSEVEYWLHSTNQHPLPMHACRCLAASLLHANGCDHSLEPMVVTGPCAESDVATVEMRFDLSQFPEAINQDWCRRINCVRASDRLDVRFPDEHSLRAWLCTRCVVTFQLAAIACGVDALALTHVIARTALVHRTRVFPFRADPAHDDGALVHAHLCQPLRDAIYTLDAAVKSEIHAAAELLRHGIVSAHANRLHSQGLTWLRAGDIANADLYAEGASRRTIGAILARPRDASAREVNLGRLVDTREAGAHALPVALAEVIQATPGYDLLDSAPGLGLRGTGFAEICAAAARVVPGDDGMDLWPSSSTFEDVAFQRGYYGDEPIQLDALRFLIASAAAFGTLLVYLSDAPPPGRERRDVLDGLPCTADVQSEDAVFKCPEKIDAAQRSAAHRIFGPDAEHRFSPSGKALAAWYEAASAMRPRPSGGLLDALDAAIGVGYAGCADEVRAKNAPVIMYLAGRIFRKHEYIGQHLRAAHAAREWEGRYERASDPVAAEHADRRAYFDARDVPYGSRNVAMDDVHPCSMSTMRVEQSEAVSRARAQIQGESDYAAWTSATAYAGMRRQDFA